MVYPGRILKIRVRGTKKDLTHQTSSSEEISIVIRGVIARFDGSDIQVLRIVIWEIEMAIKYDS